MRLRDEVLGCDDAKDGAAAMATATRAAGCEDACYDGHGNDGEGDAAERGAQDPYV